MKRTLSRLVFLTGIALCLLPSVTLAQTTPPPATTQSIISEVADAAQTLGTLTVVILVVVGVLAAIVVLLLVVAYRLGQPMVNTINSLLATVSRLQTERESEHQSQIAYRERQAELFEQATAVAERQKTMLESMSSKQEDDQRIQETAKAVITTVTEHVDTKVDALDGKLTKAINAFEELKRDSVTSQQFGQFEEHFNERFNEALELLHELQRDNAPCPPPAEVLPDDVPPNTSVGM